MLFKLGGLHPKMALMYFYNKKGHVKLKSTGSRSPMISLKAQIFI